VIDKAHILTKMTKTTSIAKKQTDQNDQQSQVTETIIMRTKWLPESDQNRLTTKMEKLPRWQKQLKQPNWQDD